MFFEAAIIKGALASLPGRVSVFAGQDAVSVMHETDAGVRWRRASAAEIDMRGAVAVGRRIAEALA